MYFIKLESLRGVAACLVVLYHSPFTFDGNSSLFIANSYLFVDFFFILSGFVMTHAYQDKIFQGLTLWNYLILRLGRLYPLHFFMLLVWVPYIAVKYYAYAKGFGSDGFLASNWESFFANIFLLHSFLIVEELSWNYPSWSISAEMVAYVMFFFMLITVDRHKTILVPLLVSLFSYFYLSWLGYKTLDIVTKYAFLRAIAGFYFGVFIFRLLQRQAVIIFLTKINKEKISFVLELLLMLLIIFCVSRAEDGSVFLVATVLLFGFAIVVFAQSKSGCIGNFLNTRYLQCLGLWSYSIYMTHAIIVSISSNIFEYLFKFELGAGFGIHSIVLNVALLAICITISRYTYDFIEQKWRSKSRHLVN